MEPRTAASQQPDAEAVEFIRFCYQRRRVGWPELYDEMCAVAARGLFRGYGSDDLAELGIGFSLFEMPALAAMSAKVVAEEQARRRPVSVTIRVDAPGSAPVVEGQVSGAAPTTEVVDAPEVVVEVPIAPAGTIAPVHSRPVGLDESERDDRTSAPQGRLSLVPTGA